MKNFALIGLGGYIAPRHLKAIKETNNNLIASLDKNDSVGIIDSYFPKSNFFVDFEIFDRYIEKIKRQNNNLDYLTICSPNYLHDAHIRYGLKTGLNVICEKPIVLNPWNLDALEKFEKQYNKNVYSVLQLRLHPSIIKLKKEIENNKNKIYDIKLTYITSRGKWYYVSWKGDEAKSGGLMMNIGVHFFDILIWIFGTVQKNVLNYYTKDKVSGYLELENARIKWFLSLDKNDIIKSKLSNNSVYRSIKVNNEEIEFSKGFTDLHTLLYKDILSNKGFTIEDTRESIELIYGLKNSKPIGLKGEYHELLKMI